MTYVFLTSVFVLLLMGGCKPSIPTSSGLTYIQMPKVPIAVSRIDVMISPCVHEENPLISLSLSEMLKQWAKDHWEVVGGGPRMTICINKVDIKEQVLACPTSLNRWTAVPNSDVYKANMMVSCELTAPNGASIGKTDFTIRYEQYVPEHYTLAQRKELWNQVYEGLINQLTIESNEHIPRLLARAPSR
jgi:hypothetical protein